VSADYATPEAAMGNIVTLFCTRCSLAVGLRPDGAIQDPDTKRWFAVVDEAPECECKRPRWVYLR